MPRKKHGSMYSLPGFFAEPEVPVSLVEGFVKLAGVGRKMQSVVEDLRNILEELQPDLIPHNPPKKGM